MTEVAKPLTADEIAQLKRNYGHITWSWEARAVTTIERQRERIEKLRNALEQIAEAGENWLPPDYTSWLQFHERIALVAREALAATEPVNDKR